MKSRSKLKKKIRGAGGGGDSSAAVEDPNTLRSSAFIRMVDLICEGEIEGLQGGARGIYLNEVPIQNPNGSLNFASTYSYETRNGTQDQSYISGFNDVESEISISQELRASPDGDIVRAITDPNVDRVRVRIQIPQLTSVDADTGDTHGSKVFIDVYVQPSGGSYSLVAARMVSGKCTSTYEFSLDVPLTGSAPWNVKVVRPTADATTGFLQNKTILDSIVQIVEAKLRYPNSAIVAVKVDAQSFSSVPSRFYDMKLLKIQVPSNYNPTTRAYTGSWDGTFQTVWSDNPAWVFYDLCTSDRYGLGAFVPADQIDKWGLYEIAQYCDTLVPDGFGGTEPRFTCNLLLQDRADAYSVLQGLASIFRGMIYWSAGAVTLTQDSPRDATYLYTPANVMEGRFVYQGASMKVRHTVVLVTWNDPANFYRPSVEYVEDQDGISRYGVQNLEITALGCTSRGQAHRLGKWLLYTEQHESETVQFKTGLDSVAGRPGQVIKIADPSRAGSRMGGRIMPGATTTVIPVDQIVPGSVSGFTLSVILPDGTLEEKTAISSSGNNITVQPGFSVAPNAQSVWMLKSTVIEPQIFRVISVAEDSQGVYTVTALSHDPDKFAAIEDNVLLETRSYSGLRDQPDPPVNLKMTESLFQGASEIKAKITISFDRVDRAKSYLLKWKRDDENWVSMPESEFNEIDILDTLPGSYQFQVFALNSFGRPSSVALLSGEAFGKLAAPNDVTGFSMVPISGKAYLTWDQTVDLDVLVGGHVDIRYTPDITGQQWKKSVQVIPAVPGSATAAFAPLQTGTYMAKFVDSSGVYSTNEVLIVTSVPEINAINLVHTTTEDPTFSGTKTDMLVDVANVALVLASNTLVDDYGLVDLIHNWDYPYGIATEGTYVFNETFDMGGVWPARIRSTMNVEAFDIGNVIDNRIELIDTWADIDGSLINDVNAQLYMRTTTDNPSGSPTYTDWKPILSGEYLARAFQFKVVATSGSEFHNLYIRGLSITIDMADRSIQGGPFASGTGASYRVNFSEPFYADPALSITAMNLGTGDFQTITNSDKTGFDVVFKNSSGTIVSRNFSYIAKGYGRKVA
jgi:predicted phage tail protein